MKQEELQRRARRELSALNIVGIPDVSAVRKAKRKIEEQKAEESDQELPPSKAKPTVVESTTVKSSTVDSTTVKTTTEGGVSQGRIEIRSNYHKFDNDVSDILAKQQTPAEQVVYHRLYRLSYGYSKNTCRVGMGALAKACNIASSSKTVRKAIEGLMDKGHIVVIEDHKNNKKGTIYRIFLPCELPGIESHTTVESTTVDSTVVENTTDDVNPLSEQDDGTVVENTTVDSTVVGSTVVFSPATTVDSTTVENTIDAVDPSLKRDDATVVNSTMVNSTTNKYKKQFKNTLSPSIYNIIYTIIGNFYEKVGQSKISREKRERAESDFEELLNDGFSPEDIQFAVEWTLENAKEEPYDFSMIKHTIGQAMAIKKKAETEKAKKLEREKMARKQKQEEEQQKAREERINAHKRGLSAGEKAKLRERAETEIRDSGKFKEEFITEYLIEAKENEILAKELADEAESAKPGKKTEVLI